MAPSVTRRALLGGTVSGLATMYPALDYADDTAPPPAPPS